MSGWRSQADAGRTMAENDVRLPHDGPPTGAAAVDGPAIRRLLEYLDSGRPARDGEWSGWQIRRVGGGRNNLLYRATGPGGDLAVKFTRQDGRDRAGHEYHGLMALRRAGLDVAPVPLLLDRTAYCRPVVVQGWLPGEVGRMPRTDDEWDGIVHHLVLAHRVTPSTTDVPLPSCSIDVRTARQGQDLVRTQLALLPADARLRPLRALVGRLAAAKFPAWRPAPVTLCRLDNNIDNYIRRPQGWASVDWEYSGWGDPAFDVANLVTHVALKDVPAGRWAWFVERYCALAEDETARQRIGVYRQIMLGWWPVRLARYLYEIPAGKDRRLAGWPEGWRADIEAKYEHYLGLAASALPSQRS